MELKHFFTVENGKEVYDDEKLYKSSLKNFEGQKAYKVIRPVAKIISPEQNSFYFGYIIGVKCKQSEIFRGWNNIIIHNTLWGILRPGERFESLNTRKKFSDYIDEVIPYLATEFKIYIEPKKNFSKIISK